jgi:hypothetical protein
MVLTIQPYFDYALPYKGTAPVKGLFSLEGIQRRATKFILQDYESSYFNRLKKLNLIPISYWHEIKDTVSCSSIQMQIRDVRT